LKISKPALLLAMATACINDGDLCEKSGVAKPTFANIKAGKRNPRPATIGKLAKALGVPVAQLVELEVV
jgi:transcriptional regulator with XRE-family HTH domain